MAGPTTAVHGRQIRLLTDWEVRLSIKQKMLEHSTVFESELRIQTAQVQIPAVLFTGYVNLSSDFSGVGEVRIT